MFGFGTKKKKAKRHPSLSTQQMRELYQANASGYERIASGRLSSVCLDAVPCEDVEPTKDKDAD